MRYAQIDKLRQTYPVATMCRALDVSESGFHAWRNRLPSARAAAEVRLSAEIQAAHRRTRETYGPERLQAELADHGVTVGVHRIKRLRKVLGLHCRQRRKFVVATDSAHGLPLAPNLLNRDFAAATPNTAWVTDITYIETAEGWLNLAGVKDVFNGGWWAMRWPSTGDRLGHAGAVSRRGRQAASAGPHSSLGSRQPVLLPGVPGFAQAVWYAVLNEPQG